MTTTKNKTDRDLLSMIRALEADLEEFKEREKSYRALVENSPDLFYRTDLDGLVTYISPSIEKLTGYTVKESLAMHMTKDIYLLSEARNSFTRKIQEQGEVKNFIAPLKRKDGTIWWGSTNAHIFTDQRDKIAGIQGIVRDVTDDILAAKSLQEKERRFRTLFDLGVEGVLLGSKEGIITEANKRMCEIFGMDRKNLIGQHISQLTFTRDSIEKSPLRFDLLQQGKKVVSERTVLRPDGSEITIEMRTIMMPDATYQSIFSDITERKQAEQRLLESEERFRALHNASFGGIVIHDQGKILDCNQGLAKMTGYTTEELIGMDGLKLIAPESLTVVKDNIQNDFEQTYEVEGSRKNGTIYPLSIRGSMIPYKGRTVRITEFRDITERKQADEEKFKLEEQLRQAQKMETVGQLAGGVAHDFNNMLGVIIGHADMAMHKTDTASTIFNDLRQIRQAAGRSAEITRQLLAFARKQTAAPKVLDLNKAVKSMVQMLRRLIGEDIELVWLPEDNLWPVKIDTSQLNQVLVNLCINSRDAISGVGQLTVKIDNNILTDGDYIRLAVSDNGTGMDEETLKHVFEPFFTTKDVGEGTGLGLATVYGIVKQNNGIINVFSDPQQGTTFEIFLPRYVGLTTQSQPTGGIEPNAHGSETILIIEDELSMLQMSKEMLEILGYRVLATNSPIEALRIEKEFSDDIHLLLTDVIMPEMNGPDLAKQLLANRPTTKLLYMSGYPADIITKQGLLDEGIELIQKPFSQQELAARIRHTLENAQEV